jgi:hypothetical protein
MALMGSPALAEGDGSDGAVGASYSECIRKACDHFQHRAPVKPYSGTGDERPATVQK